MCRACRVPSFIPGARRPLPCPEPARGAAWPALPGPGGRGSAHRCGTGRMCASSAFLRQFARSAGGLSPRARCPRPWLAPGYQENLRLTALSAAAAGFVLLGREGRGERGGRLRLGLLCSSVGGCRLPCGGWQGGRGARRPAGCAAQTARGGRKPSRPPDAVTARAAGFRAGRKTHHHCPATRCTPRPAHSTPWRAEKGGGEGDLAPSGAKRQRAIEAAAACLPALQPRGSALPAAP